MTQTNGAEDDRYLPESTRIRAELKSLLEDRRPNDTVLVAFAGHGVQPKGTKENYFCPMDTKLANKDTLISLRQVYSDLESSKAGVKLLFVDACRNDPQSDFSRARAEVDLDSISRPQELIPPRGVAAFFSCSAGEKAFESPTLRHGVFFHFVLQGLKGKAANNKGEIQLTKLIDYVQSQVIDQVKDEFGGDVRQRPQLIGEIDGSVVLARGTALNTTTDPINRAELDKLREALIHLERGKLLLETNVEDALNEFDQAIQADPKFAEAYAYRANAFDNLQRFDEGIADANKAIELDPTSALAYTSRGELDTDKEDFEKGMADYNKAIALDVGAELTGPISTRTSASPTYWQVVRRWRVRVH